METQLFMFLAEGVASEATNKRAGARHALVMFAKAQNIDAAQIDAVTSAGQRGWLFVEIKRGKEIAEDFSAISDEVLRKAAQSAHQKGFSIVIYKDEIDPNS